MSEENNLIDLTKINDNIPKISIETTEIPKQSPLWADLAKPFAIMIFILVLLIILIPFILLLIFPGSDRQHWHQMIISWANTALTPIVALTASIVAYYFGTSKN